MSHSIPQRFAPKADELRSFYVGKDIKDVPKPAVVLDRAKMRRHCNSLLEATKSLGLGFRAHIKTHKTREGARLQAGESGADVKLIVSTLAEFEFILPVLNEFKSDGRKVDVLYGLPLPASQTSRLAAIARQLGPGVAAVLIDHPSQLDAIEEFFNIAGFSLRIYVKVDTGYHRAGLPPKGVNKGDLINQLIQLESRGLVELVGFYSHSSLSYNDSTPKDAMTNLQGEIDGCLDALRTVRPLFSAQKKLVISVGASPQVTSIENLVDEEQSGSEATASLRRTIESFQHRQEGELQLSLEVHAGVYSILDVQQLATKSRARLGSCEREIAISIVAEITSIYNNGERPQPEALAAVGVLGLGREPCVAYKGWGIVDDAAYSRAVEPRQRIIVERISQEHCILAWERETDDTTDVSIPKIPLQVGQVVRIYPNHACIAGALYGWYLIVDSDEEQKTRVVDVWIRASGW